MDASTPLRLQASKFYLTLSTFKGFKADIMSVIVSWHIGYEE